MSISENREGWTDEEVNEILHGRASHETMEPVTVDFRDSLGDGETYDAYEAEILGAMQQEDAQNESRMKQSAGVTGDAVRAKLEALLDQGRSEAGEP